MAFTSNLHWLAGVMQMHYLTTSKTICLSLWMILAIVYVKEQVNLSN
jgi:hypothetical protein